MSQPRLGKRKSSDSPDTPPNPNPNLNPARQHAKRARTRGDHSALRGDPFLAVSYDCSAHILRHIDIQSLERCRWVSKAWKAHVDEWMASGGSCRYFLPPGFRPVLPYSMGHGERLEGVRESGETPLPN